MPLNTLAMYIFLDKTADYNLAGIINGHVSSISRLINYYVRKYENNKTVGHIALRRGWDRVVSRAHLTRTVSALCIFS